MKEINITFDKDGNVSIEAMGFKGTSCEKATQAIEKALAGKDFKKSLKPEYYEKEFVTNNINQR